jgi:hypothetical protein
MEEELEAVTYETVSEENPPEAQPARPPMGFGDRLIQQVTRRKYYVLATIAVLVLAGIALLATSLGNKNNTLHPSGFSSLPTETPSTAPVTSNETMKLAFAVSFAEAKAGQALPVQPVVKIVDADGNTVSGATVPVTLIVTDHRAKLYGETTVNAVNGIATFTDLSIQLAGSQFTLTALSPGLASVISEPFSVKPGPAVALEFLGKPTNSGLPAYFSLVVAVVDAYNNIVTDSSAEVTLSLAPGTPEAIFSGVTTKKAKSGIASFSYLYIDPPNSIYKLTATSPGLTQDTSDAFNPSKITAES